MEHTYEAVKTGLKKSRLVKGQKSRLTNPRKHTAFSRSVDGDPPNSRASNVSTASSSSEFGISKEISRRRGEMQKALVSEQKTSNAVSDESASKKLAELEQEATQHRLMATEVRSRVDELTEKYDAFAEGFPDVDECLKMNVDTAIASFSTSAVERDKALKELNEAVKKAEGTAKQAGVSKKSFTRGVDGKVLKSVRSAVQSDLQTRTQLQSVTDKLLDSIHVLQVEGVLAVESLQEQLASVKKELKFAVETAEESERTNERLERTLKEEESAKKQISQKLAALEKTLEKERNISNEERKRFMEENSKQRKQSVEMIQEVMQKGHQENFVVSELKMECTKATKLMEEAQADLSLAYTSLQKEQSTNAALSAEAARLKKQLAEAQRETGEAKLALEEERVKREAEKANAVPDMSAEEKQALLLEQQEQQKILNSLRKDRKQLKQEKESLQENLSDIQRKCESQLGEIAKMKMSSAEATADLSNEISALQSDIEAKNEALETQKASHSAEVAKVQEELESWKKAAAERESNSTDPDTLLREMSSLREHHATEIAATREGHKKTVDRLRERIQELEAALNARAVDSGPEAVAEAEETLVAEAEETPLEVVAEAEETPLEVVAEAEETPLEVVAEAEETPLEVVAEAEETPLEVVAEAEETPLEVVDEAEETPLELVAEAEETPLELVAEAEETPLELVDEAEADEIAKDASPSESADEVRHLEELLHDSQQTSAKLDQLLLEEQSRLQEAEETLRSTASENADQIAALTRENDLLKRELKEKRENSVPVVPSVQPLASFRENVQKDDVGTQTDEITQHVEVPPTELPTSIILDSSIARSVAVTVSSPSKPDSRAEIRRLEDLLRLSRQKSAKSEQVLLEEQSKLQGIEATLRATESVLSENSNQIAELAQENDLLRRELKEEREKISIAPPSPIPVEPSVEETQAQALSSQKIGLDMEWHALNNSVGSQTGKELEAEYRARRRSTIVCGLPIEEMQKRLTVAVQMLREAKKESAELRSKVANLEGAIDERQGGTVLFHAFVEHPSNVLDLFSRITRGIDSLRRSCECSEGVPSGVLRQMREFSETVIAPLSRLQGTFQKNRKEWERAKYALKRAQNSTKLKSTSLLSVCPICKQVQHKDVDPLDFAASEEQDRRHSRSSAVLDALGSMEREIGRMTPESDAELPVYPSQLPSSPLYYPPDSPITRSGLGFLDLEETFPSPVQFHPTVGLPPVTPPRNARSLLTLPITQDEHLELLEQPLGMGGTRVSVQRKQNHNPTLTRQMSRPHMRWKGVDHYLARDGAVVFPGANRAREERKKRARDKRSPTLSPAVHPSPKAKRHVKQTGNIEGRFDLESNHHFVMPSPIVVSRQSVPHNQGRSRLKSPPQRSVSPPQVPSVQVLHKIEL